MIDLLPETIYLREPFWLAAITLPYLFHLLKEILSSKSQSFADSELLPWITVTNKNDTSKHFYNKNNIFILAWILFCISLAGPRSPEINVLNDQTSTSDIMIVLDVSSSMQANDIFPSRIIQAKTGILDFVRLARGHRIGITVYAAKPHLYVPLTKDYEVLEYFTEKSDQLILPTLGSNIQKAILFAQNELKTSNAAILLITDGDIDNNNHAEMAIKKSTSHPVFILGVGTTEGEAITNSDGEWLKYNNTHVISRMNENALKQLAESYQGKYIRVSNDNTDLEELYSTGIKNLHKPSSKNQDERLWKEHYQWFLIPAILFFLLAYFPVQVRHIIPASLLAFLIVTPVSETQAFDLFRTDKEIAYKTYLEGKYEKSIKIYQTIDDFDGYLGLANSFYKDKKYKKSVSFYLLALKETQTEKQRGHVLYNLGNAYLRSGKFSQSLEAYIGAQQYLGSFPALKHNISTSKELIKNLAMMRRVEDYITTPRKGRGNRTADSPEEIDIENTAVSTGESSENNNPNYIGKSESLLISKNFQKLLKLGLEQVRLADQTNQERTTGDKNTYTPSDILAAERKSSDNIEQNHLLWKRIFEIEEGFPAPQDEPVTIPGEKPW